VHGLRVTEIINLRRRDFNRDGDTIYLTVQRLKGSERTIQKLNASDEPLLDLSRPPTMEKPLIVFAPFKEQLIRNR
jgi:integrase